MKETVSSLQSQPVFPINEEDALNSYDFSYESNKDDYTCTEKINKYQTDMNNFKKFSTKYGISMRNHDAIMQLLKNYHKLISTNHGFRIEPIISNFFDCFFLNLQMDMDEINNISVNSTGKEKSDVIENKLIKKLDNALESIRIFREYIGTYLNDLLRSGRSFIEGRIMTHPSIVSLTKLLFAYNGYVNTLIKNIEKIDNDATNNIKPACVVVSGGCDYTGVNDIFSHRKTETSNSCKMFVVSIPEITLFDIKGTLLRLEHECFHCFADHHRDIRFEKAIYAVHSYVADTCANYFFSDEALLLNFDNSFLKSKAKDINHTYIIFTLDDLADAIFHDAYKKMAIEKMMRYIKRCENNNSDLKVNRLDVDNIIKDSKTTFLSKILGNKEYAYERVMFNFLVRSQTEYWEANNIKPIWTTIGELPRLITRIF